LAIRMAQGDTILETRKINQVPLTFLPNMFLSWGFSFLIILVWFGCIYHIYICRNACVYKCTDIYIHIYVNLLANTYLW
jgi:hypothetical protein